MFLLKRGIYSFLLWRSEFTFHNVSIKTGTRQKHNRFLQYLHSTMFLLKQMARAAIDGFEDHLHSTMFLLKPRHLHSLYPAKHNLHSTMFLLKPDRVTIPGFRMLHLHSTMFLLKLETVGSFPSWSPTFTFHNVSIKTIKQCTNNCWKS